ncbi:MAG: MFS transporter [Gammaproteobacteria bacterium]|nr:MFS transporter [Gammaproteobacteria bacterium]
MSENKGGFWPWLAWFATAFFYAYQYFLQVSPSVMVKSLMRAFNADATSLSILVSFYFWAYAFSQIPLGAILDKFGVRRLLTASALLVAIGSTLFAASHMFFLASLGRLLIGLGGGSAAIGCMYIAANAHPTNRFSILTGLLLSIGMIGAISAQAPLAVACEDLGWRPTILLLSAIGLLLAILLWTCLAKIKKTSNNTNNTADKLWDGMRAILKKQQIWMLAAYAGLMLVPTTVFGALWGGPYLRSAYHLSNKEAATLISMIFVGWIFGAPILGWISDRTLKRNPVMYVSAIGTLITTSLIIYLLDFTYYELALLIFCTGFFSSGLIVAFSSAKENSSPNTTGACMGFMNGLNMLGGAILPPIIGLILDRYRILNFGVASYSTHGYQISLSILPICVFIALILLLFVRETNGNTINNL